MEQRWVLRGPCAQFLTAVLLCAKAKAAARLGAVCFFQAGQCRGWLWSGTGMLLAVCTLPAALPLCADPLSPCLSSGSAGPSRTTSPQCLRRECSLAKAVLCRPFCGNSCQGANICPEWVVSSASLDWEWCSGGDEWELHVLQRSDVVCWAPSARGLQSGSVVLALLSWVVREAVGSCGWQQGDGEDAARQPSAVPCCCFPAPRWC